MNPDLDWFQGYDYEKCLSKFKEKYQDISNIDQIDHRLVIDCYFICCLIHISLCERKSYRNFELSENEIFCAQLCAGLMIKIDHFLYFAYQSGTHDSFSGFEKQYVYQYRNFTKIAFPIVEVFKTSHPNQAIKFEDEIFVLSQGFLDSVRNPNLPTKEVPIFTSLYVFLLIADSSPDKSKFKSIIESELRVIFSYPFTVISKYQWVSRMFVGPHFDGMSRQNIDVLCNQVVGYINQLPPAQSRGEVLLPIAGYLIEAISQNNQNSSLTENSLYLKGRLLIPESLREFEKSKDQKILQNICSNLLNRDDLIYFVPNQDLQKILELISSKDQQRFCLVCANKVVNFLKYKRDIKENIDFAQTVEAIEKLLILSSKFGDQYQNSQNVEYVKSEILSIVNLYVSFAESSLDFGIIIDLLDAYKVDFSGLDRAIFDKKLPLFANGNLINLAQFRILNSFFGQDKTKPKTANAIGNLKSLVVDNFIFNFDKIANLDKLSSKGILDLIDNVDFIKLLFEKFEKKPEIYDKFSGIIVLESKPELRLAQALLKANFELQKQQKEISELKKKFEAAKDSRLKQGLSKADLEKSSSELKELKEKFEDLESQNKVLQEELKRLRDENKLSEKKVREIEGLKNKVVKQLVDLRTQSEALMESVEARNVDLLLQNQKLQLESEALKAQLAAALDLVRKTEEAAKKQIALAEIKTKVAKSESKIKEVLYKEGALNVFGQLRQSFAFCQMGVYGSVVYGEMEKCGALPKQFRRKREVEGYSDIDAFFVIPNKNFLIFLIKLRLINRQQLSLIIGD